MEGRERKKFMLGCARMREKVNDGMAAARKTRWLMTGLVAAALAALAIFVGATGCTSTPSRFEARFYDIDRRAPRGSSAFVSVIPIHPGPGPRCSFRPRTRRFTRGLT